VNGVAFSGRGLKSTTIKSKSTFMRMKCGKAYGMPPYSLTVINGNGMELADLWIDLKSR